MQGREAMIITRLSNSFNGWAQLDLFGLWAKTFHDLPRYFLEDEEAMIM